MCCTKKIYIKIKKQKKNNICKEKDIKNINEKIYFKKIKAILEILIGLTLFCLMISISIYTYYNIKAHILNKKIDKETSKTINLFYENLKEFLLNTKKLNNTNISLSQSINLNEILKLSAYAINENILSSNNGEIFEDKYLGIYKYYCDNLKLKKNIGKKILINDFFEINENKLVGKKFNIKHYSFEIINNIYNTIFYTF